jgi:FkbM family methyltransferase
VLTQRLKHWASLALDSSYRAKRNETVRLQSLPKHAPDATSLLGQNIKILDAESFLYTYGEIFEREIYRFQTAKTAPVIIDCGANIGLATIYFKRLYPQSVIIAFEPDPQIFEVLSNNCRVFSTTGVELINKGLWNKEAVVSFKREGSEAGRISNNGGFQSRVINISTVSLRDYLKKPVDFLKMDIEGAETEVLNDCADLLGKVDNIFVEYHSFPNRPQTLHRILEILAASGFRIQVQSVNICPFPYIERPLYFGMDAQLNIFGFRS